MSLLAAALAVVAAGTNAGSEVLQRKANKEQARIVDAIRQPVWLAGFGGVAAAFLVQAAALRYGPLAVVQPILIVELPATVLLASAVFHRRVSGRDLGAIVATTAGLALLIGCLGPSGGSPSGVNGVEWALGTGVTLLAVGALTVTGRRSAGGRRAALLGVATGCSFGLTAAFMSAVSRGLSHGLVAVLGLWQTYAMAATGVTAMLLLQSALQAGTLVASQPGITLADPMVSILWGALLFGERLRSGLWVVGACAGIMLLAAGTLVISKSDVLQPNDPDGAPGERGGGRTRR